MARLLPRWFRWGFVLCAIAALLSTRSSGLAGLPPPHPSPPVEGGQGGRDASPIFQIAFSENYVTSSLAQQFDRTDQVDLLVNGFNVQSSGRFQGQGTVKLVPCSDQAVLCMAIEGGGLGQSFLTRNHLFLETKDKVRFHTLWTLIFTPDGPEAFPMPVHARTHSRLSRSHTDMGPVADLLTRGAIRTDYPLIHMRVDNLGSSVAAEVIHMKIEQEVTEKLAQAKQSFQEDLHDRATGIGLRSEELRFSTTSDQLLITAALPGACPDTLCPRGRDAAMTMRLHQSLANELSRRSLSEKTITGEDMEKNAKKSYRRLGIPTPRPPERLDWSITFDKDRPVIARIEKGKLGITLRGREFQSGGTTYPAMDVTAWYLLKPVSDGIRLSRPEQLVIYPPNFVPGSGVRLSAREQTLRTILQRRFGRLFPQEFTFQLPDMPGRSRKSPSLQVSSLRADQGWLVLEADMPPTPTPPEHSPQSTFASRP